MSPRIRAERLQRVSVLFEDDDLLAVAKPPGIAVHGGAGETKKTLLDILTAAYAAPVPLTLAHRLDRGTSGVLLLTKRPELAKVLMGLWPSAEKTYLAVALGRIDDPIRVDRALEDGDGRARSAATRFTPRRPLTMLAPETTLVEAVLETGRTHQIRRHLASIGHPVLMDDRYGDFAANKAWARAVRDAGGTKPKHLMLHARRLALPHPTTGAPLAFEADPPPAWGPLTQ